MKEVWKDIQEFQGLYQVSNLGRIKSLKRKTTNGIILKPVLNNMYYKVSLSKNNVKKNYNIHRLVAKEFIDNIDNKPQINHKDGNKINNNVDNLEWCTRLENVNHAWKKGLSKPHKYSVEERLKIQKSLKEYYNKSHTKTKNVDKRFGNHCKIPIGLKKDDKIIKFDSKKELCRYLGIQEKTFWRYEKRGDTHIYNYEIVNLL